MEHSPGSNGRAPITFDSLRGTDGSPAPELVVQTCCALFVRSLSELQGWGEESIAQGEDRISTLFPRGFGTFFGMTAPNESGEPGITVAGS